MYPDNADLLAYRRYDGETELLVLCNLREREIAKPLPVGWTDAEKLLGNDPDTADTLRPYECVVLNKGKCFCLAHYEVTIAKDTVNSQ